jgi:hypothetical protein
MLIVLVLASSRIIAVVLDFIGNMCPDDQSCVKGSSDETTSQILNNNTLFCPSGVGLKVLRIICTDINGKNKPKQISTDEK